MVTLLINGREVTVKNGTTVLEAAEQLGIAIPTLCHRKGRPPNTTCMLCRVEDLGADNLILACAVKAAEGMRIETESVRVRESRKDTLDLLLSEHV
jgi:NADH dehydrogenase/NADH:ubiquinone oxidoreductase subunit G